MLLQSQCGRLHTFFFDQLAEGDAAMSEVTVAFLTDLKESDSGPDLDSLRETLSQCPDRDLNLWVYHEVLEMIARGVRL